MKCLNAGCGTEGTKPFCPDCGSKMISTEGLGSSSNDTTKRCSGKREDGNLCEAILKPEHAFCDCCETKVNGPAREQSPRNMQHSNLNTVKDGGENIMPKDDKAKTRSEQTLTGAKSGLKDELMSELQNPDNNAHTKPEQVERVFGNVTRTQNGHNKNNHVDLSSASSGSCVFKQSNTTGVTAASKTEKEIMNNVVSDSELVDERAMRSSKNTGDNIGFRNRTDTVVNKSAQENTTSHDHNANSVKVVFHVLVHAEVLSDIDDRLLVGIQGTDFGGWTNVTNFMSKIRNDGNYCEYTYEKRILRSRLMSSMQYKYCFKLTKEEDKAKIVWEKYYVYKQPNTDKHANRKLFVEHKSLGKKDVWHQHDGVIIPNPNTTLFKKLVQKAKNLITGHETAEHIQFANAYFTWFVPDIFRHPLGSICKQQIDDSIDELKMLLNGLRKVYYVDWRFWEREEDFKNEIAGKPLGKLIAMMVESQQDLITRMIQSMSIAVACSSIKLAIPQQAWQQLCAISVPTVDASNRCVEWDPVCNHFTKESIKVAMLGLVHMHMEGTDRDPSWMLCMPLLHLVCGVCAPFEEPKVDLVHDDKTPKWWGIAEVSNVVEKFKGKRNWLISPRVVVAKLQPLFKMDFYLPRCIVASLDINCLNELQQEWVPIEVACAALVFWTRHTRDLFYYDENAKKVDNAITTVMNRLQGTFPTENRSRTGWTMAYKIAYKLVIESFKDDIQRWEKQLHTVHIYLHCVAMYDSLISNKDSHVPRDHIDTIDSVVEKCMGWFAMQDVISSTVNNFVEKWNMAFPPVLASNKILLLWNDKIAKCFEATLLEQCNHSSLIRGAVLDLYCKAFDKYCIYVQRSLKSVAFRGLEHGGLDFYYASSVDTANARYGELLSTMFLMQWSVFTTSGSKDALLKMALEWQPMDLFINNMCKKNRGEASFALRAECDEKIKTIWTVIDGIRESIANGSVVIGMLEYVNDHTKNFCEMVSANESNPNKCYATQNLISMRMKEVNELKNQTSIMAKFVSLCELYKVDTLQIQRIMHTNVEERRINELVEPEKISRGQNLEEYVPDIIVFKSFQYVLDVLIPCSQSFDSFVFNILWDTHRTSITKEHLPIIDLLETVLKPVHKRWQKLCYELASGDILFHTFEEMFGNPFRNDEERLIHEMTMCNVSLELALNRIEQFNQLKTLRECAEGANAILKLADTCKLRGDFNPIRTIAAHTSHAVKLKDFDKSLMRTSGLLLNVTPEMSECLNTFTECQDLVKWLQDTMNTSGQKELKVFIDLALMSVGDDPMNNGKVECLHSAAIGYSPLIFGLESTSGYEELLEKCADVWNELNVNPKLPEQLADTNTQLIWLKEIERAHGSVEVNSLAQAEAINSDGIFTLGTLEHNYETDKHLMNEDMIKLTIPKQNKKYTFKQLQDLQSRLMLVAGQAVHATRTCVGVERFTVIFDSVTRLANVLRKLRVSGCVLFNEWQGQFWCSPDRPVCVELTFGNVKSMPTLKSRSSERDVQDTIPEIAKFMETCLEEWLKYIKTMRSKFYYLNYFTTDQLVILQRELVKFGEDNSPLHLVYPLLSAVKRDCSPGDLKEAVMLVTAEVEKQIEPPKVNDDEATNTDTTYKIDQQKEAFVQGLIASGFQRQLAEQAIGYIDEEDIITCNISQGILWCMEEDGKNSQSTKKDSVESKETTHNGDTDSHTKPSSTLDSIIETHLKEHLAKAAGVDTLFEHFRNLWRIFIESVTSNVRDYVSLEQLGLILQQLADTDEKVERSFAKFYKSGEPNLIICQPSEILNVALSMYMHENTKPLPSADEVLLCDSNTTGEEVDIFWRRALFGDGKKIYSLVNADVLPYDVSSDADQSLQDLISETNTREGKQYRLAIICGSDNEYRCPFVSSLDKYVRPTPTIQQEAVQAYIEAKLVVQNHIAASIVDFKRCSVRVVKSNRAGVGKSLYIKRQAENLKTKFAAFVNVQTDHVSIPLQEKFINTHEVTHTLLKYTSMPELQTARLFHIDISHEVQEGIDILLFNLLILGCLVDNNGHVWRRSRNDLYLIEAMPIMKNNMYSGRAMVLQFEHPIFAILPAIKCTSPQQSLRIYQGEISKDFQSTDQLFDEKLFRSSEYQRTFQYLKRLDSGQTSARVNPSKAKENQSTCLNVLLGRCGVIDPSWSELHHFVMFLNTQLVEFEQNHFVSAEVAGDLPGFATFVLRFLLQMSKDFASRSLTISEETPRLVLAESEDEDVEHVLNRFTLRRTWENSPHPYLFFNSDHQTFTFLGFYIEKGSGNMIDRTSGNVLEKAIMPKNLHTALTRNRVPLQESFDDLDRSEKIWKVCNVMNIKIPYDPDDTYELTTDNIKKMLAIYMRFRCDIPVIIMGETGCGKTRLVKFMCALQSPPGVEVNNMLLMKVHGGITKGDIVRKVHSAEEIAKENVVKYGADMFTILFFDEANTTESIGIMKEIMCDKSICGEPLKLFQNLKIIAACNPYRKHPDALIQKLEQAGLGYHVDADETKDRLGRVPMRRLVYRVQPLPQSLLPLVWDFGQLNTEVENLYVRQMVQRYVHDGKLPNKPGFVNITTQILTVSQRFMRDQKNECSYVSLRDVERVLLVTTWFYGQTTNRLLFNEMDRKLSIANKYESVAVEDATADENQVVVEQPARALDDLTRSLVLALGVCYHACLKSRAEYRATVAAAFSDPCPLHRGAGQILEEIECCQDVFLDHVSPETTIARNNALKENVFMMVVCIELRIPLFLIGKPGSSKSLAKTIVADAMQGHSGAKSPLFKQLKQVQMVSYQCSPLSTPDGIVGTFNQCAQFQKEKDLNRFVSVVVLDEVGLAEDSPRMPLKTLHPLLEDGCQGEEKQEPHKKVAFIGISNWALDPAKMNRGILVQREVPDIEELQNSARGICQMNKDIRAFIEPLIKPLSHAYLDVFRQASTQKREFYGLRDFYSLLKMIYSFVDKSKQPLTWFELLHAVKRNFGGLELVNPEKYFKDHLRHVMHCSGPPKVSDPDCSPQGLIEACLFDSVKLKTESRYLLLLTDNYGAFSIIQQQLFSKSSGPRPIIIFGSSFRSDQEYTQVCRNIHRIKVCMETGNTVVLLNLENLYESLYDALNQYYVHFGGIDYVDLGLGTHRVKCPVHKKFRLIVVAEKQTVYNKFPIPLINRLEKHFLTVHTILNERQMKLATELHDWAKQFASHEAPNTRGKKQRQVGEVFIGFHEDTCASITLHVFKRNAEYNISDQDVLEEGKQLLIWCATPESFVSGNLLDKAERDRMARYYNKRQAHNSFLHYLSYQMETLKCKELFAQITCHSKMLPNNFDKVILEGVPCLHKVELLSLSAFDTEQQFSNRVKQHLTSTSGTASLLVIQCESGDVNSKLIASARYCVMDVVAKINKERAKHVFIVFIVQLPRKPGGCFFDFQCGDWNSAHIDEMFAEDVQLPDWTVFKDKKVSEIFTSVQVHQHLSVVSEDADFQTCIDPMGQDTNIESEPTDTNTHKRNKSSVSKAESPDKDSACLTQTRSDCYTNQIVYLTGIVRSCVPHALSMVKDTSKAEQRETKRVEIVLGLLCTDKENPGTESFTTGIFSLISKMFREKEYETGYIPQKWLERHAAASENINKHGTFRRSCFNTIVSKVTPVLAGIISFLDTNSNMDLIMCNEQWKSCFWLKCLHRTHALPLKYYDCHSPNSTECLEEMLVASTGYEGHEFKLRLPFSWVIIHMVDEVFRNHVSDTEDDANRIDLCVTTLNSAAEGQLLSDLKDLVYGVNRSSEEKDSLQQEILMDYIHDFVHTVYHAETEAELNIVCETVLLKTIKICQDTGHPLDIYNQIVCSRVAFEELALRLTYFRSINSVWPQCSVKICQMKESNPNHFMFKEHEFTFSTLCLLIEDLNPVAQELDDKSTRQKWLVKVHKYRPVVETMLAIPMNDSRVGAHSDSSINSARSKWSRVVVVKLFIENVCGDESEKHITIKYCMPLWQLLRDDVNLSTKGSFEAVEKFLKICNKTAFTEIIGTAVKCGRCEDALQSSPITVPCNSKDILCQKCFTEMKVLEEYRCPVCKEELNQEWEPDIDEKMRISIEKLQKYQKRCNTFFLEIVSQLCFAQGVTPSDEVLQRLLGYVTCKTKSGKMFTKNINLFDTGLDPNPVFRSFLLKLILKASDEKCVSEYLRKFIDQAELDDDVGAQERIDMFLLIVQCWEDIQVQCIEQSGDSRATLVCSLLQNASGVFNNHNSKTELLYAIATARACLATATRCMAEYCHTNIKDIPMYIWSIITSAKTFCTDSCSESSKGYIVKLLCRQYGIYLYSELARSSSPLFNWIAINGTMDQTEVSDRYIVAGQSYIRVRELLTQILLGGEISVLENLLEELKKCGERLETVLQLAVHREITCSNVRHVNQTRQNAIKRLSTFLMNSDITRDKDFLEKLLSNDLQPQFLNMRHETDMFHQGLQCLLVHFKIVMSKLQYGSSILDPYLALINGNPTIQTMLLPTMPQDDLEDVHRAVLREQGNENTAVYCCPKGHPYFIGDCGKPDSVGYCIECREQVGGKRHKPLLGNVASNIVDTTKRGHVLGKAIDGVVLQPERDLNPTYCAVVRLMLHMAMYLGPVEQIQAIIKPQIAATEVSDFVMNHIKANVSNLKRALGRSVDDVILLMHVVIDKIEKEGEAFPAKLHLLSSKADRKSWENSFATIVLRGILSQAENWLMRFNHEIVNDQRLGADPLLCLIYETENRQEAQDLEQLLEVPRMWRFRVPITIEHMSQELDSKMLELKRPPRILHRFLNEDYILQALRYLPSIMQLQRALLRRFQRKLDKAEAKRKTVKDFKTELSECHDVEKWIDAFSMAWGATRTFLQHGCLTKSGRYTLPEELCNEQINDDTSLAIFLPTTDGPGLCSYAMIDYLFRKQNEMLEYYGQNSDRLNIPSVKPMNVNAAHLICYDHEHDIVPILLANCQYSFEIGVGTTVDYDFGGMERQLIDRLLYSKSKIELRPFLEVDLMVYRNEITNTAVLKKLQEKIPQAHLSDDVRKQICEELRALPEVFASLDNLDTAIGFLKTAGGEPIAKLGAFMVEVLGIENPILSQKARQICELQHARSLWLLLSFHKSKLLVDLRQPTEEVFETFPDNLCQDIPDNAKPTFEEYMKHLSIDKLHTMLEVMHEFLILVIAVRQNPDDKDYVDTENYCLFESLKQYIDLDDTQLLDGPSNILYKHGAYAWVMAYETLCRKIGTRRRS